MDDPGFETRQRQRLSLLQIVQTVCGDHPASCSMDTRHCPTIVAVGLSYGHRVLTHDCSGLTIIFATYLHLASRLRISRATRSLYVYASWRGNRIGFIYRLSIQYIHEPHAGTISNGLAVCRI
jgi:hypothetical protein